MLWTTFPCHPQHVPTTYTNTPQYIPTIYTAVYVVGIYCGYFVYIVGMCCGWQGNVVHNIYRFCIYCGQHDYIVGNIVENVIHNIYGCTHNVYPQYISLHVVGTFCGRICICCGSHVVGNILWRTRVYSVGNKVWVTYCGWQHISCGVGIVDDHVYIVGIRLERVIHNIYVWTHNTYPQHIQKYGAPSRENVPQVRVVFILKITPGVPPPFFF